VKLEATWIHRHLASYITKSARLSLPMKNLFGSMSENIQWKRSCVDFTSSHLVGDLRIFTHKTSQRKNSVHVSQIKNGGMWVDRNGTSLLAVLEPLAWSCVPK